MQFDVALLEGVALDLKGTEDLSISSPVWSSLVAHILDITDFDLYCMTILYALVQLPPHFVCVMYDK